MLIVLNIYVTFFLIKATARFTHSPLLSARLIVSSVIGSLFSLVMLLPRINFLLLFTVKVLAAFIIVLIAFVNPKLAISAGIAFLIICVFAVYRALSAKGRYKRFLIKTTKKLDFTDEKVLSTSPFPVAVCDEKGYITWCNNRFINEIS